MDLLNRFAAIDPMALILSGKAYLIWVEIHHPHEPSVADIKQLFERMSADEKKAAVAQAKRLANVCKTVVEAAR